MMSSVRACSDGLIVHPWESLGVVASYSFRAHNYALRPSQPPAEQEAVKSARAQWLTACGHDPSQAVFMNQVHGNAIAEVTAADAGRGMLDCCAAIPECDAMICSTPGIVLCVLTADCVPVFLFDALRRVVAVVHAGWRGTREKIIFRAVQSMCHKFSSDPDNIHVLFGPSIRTCCYEVGSEFLNYFPESVHLRSNQCYFDIIAEITRHLTDAGVQPELIGDLNMCTYCQRDKFFSYRAGDQYARNLSAISLCP